MRARLIGCLLFGIVAAAPIASAQSAGPGTTVQADPGRLAAARQLFTLLQAGDRARKSIEQIFGTASDAALRQVLSNGDSKDPNFGERQRRLALVRKTELTDLMNEIMPQMIEDMIAVYARDFTVEELNAATAYYGTPAGQAFLRKQPMVLREVTQTVFPKLMPMIQKRAADVKAKMDAAVADLPPPPAN